MLPGHNEKDIISIIMAIQMPLKDESERRSYSAYSAGNASSARPFRQGASTGMRRKDQALLRVLGVALIVEERGAGARLVARYPTHPSTDDSQPLQSTTDRSSGTFQRDNNRNAASDAQRDGDDTADDNENSQTNDLFFTLTVRQLAKLFRTKKSLCNQPMTLRVNRTIFCCHAVLMDSAEEGVVADTKASAETSCQDGAANFDTELTHFSIVVALSAPVGEAAVPFSTFWDGSNEDKMDLERYLQHIATNDTDGKHDVKKKKEKTAARVSSAFLAVRRVHISLARLCRALEREEHRCRYVSLQSSAFFKIRNEQQKRWEEIAMVTSRSGTDGKQSGTSSGTVLSGGNNESHPRKGRHVRQNSFGTAAGGATALENAFQKLVVTHSVRQEQEKEQEILEIMLSLAPPERRPGIPKHHGNLVRELCSVYHALSRKDYEYPPTPASLLCEQESVVYINQHLAIPIEAVGLDGPQSSISMDKGCLVQPYHTLLFPYASPSELLQTFLSDGSAAPQRMEQLLLTVNPQKPLTEIAIEADLPLHVALEIASFLVLRHVCVTSQVVSLESRLACLAIDRIPDLLLDFSQAFPGINLFAVTSFLTNSPSLGHTMSTLTRSENEDGLMLREMLMASPIYQNRQRKTDSGSGFQRNRFPGLLSNSIDTAYVMSELNSSRVTTQSNTVPAPQEDSIMWHQQLMKDLEEILFSISVWLLSRRIITHMCDYIIVVGAMESFRQESKQPINSSDPDEMLFKELLDLGYLNGDVSITALSWRLGMDPKKLKSWGLRHPSVSVLTRVPRSLDDGTL